ncbi:hypothetical protein EB061_12390 [bacterium]|nr:hypothetical protein [bacterium]
MGVLFSGDDRILFNDALFYHLDDSTVKIVNRDPKHPFDGECEIEKISYKGLRDGDEIEIDEIQYAMNAIIFGLCIVAMSLFFLGVAKYTK